jgi:hypothetical protein
MLAVAVGTPTITPAQPVAANSNVTYYGTHASCSMIIVPDGSGTPLTACWGPGGVSTSTTLLVELKDASFNDVAYFPQRSIRLTMTPPTPLAWCPMFLYPPPDHGPNCADSDTDILGHTKFTLAYHGGGWQDRPARVWVEEAPGAWASIPVNLPVYFNSIDITGDLRVDLADLGAFVTHFYGPYCYCIDYNYDGNNDLADLGIFSSYYLPLVGVICP